MSDSREAAGVQPVRSGTVLIVDDEPAIREILVQAFADEGYATATAAHGKEALAYLQSAATLPRLILLDIMMPVMNGTQLWRTLKATPRWASIPVMILSAGIYLQQAGPALSVAAMIPKPIDLVRLLHLARPYLAPLDRPDPHPLGERSA